MKDKQMLLKVKLLFSTLKRNKNLTFFHLISLKNENNHFVK